MNLANRFVLATLLALVAVYAPARAEEAAAPSVGVEHVCLNQKERQVEADNGRLVRLATAIHASRSRMPGTVVQARLCRSPDGLVYVLTVLARDGRVARIAVDAVKGTLIGGL
jgi:uncharacterized membrane protein YkoI